MFLLLSLCFSMPRIHQRKTTRGLIPHEVMKVAAEEVLSGSPIRLVAQRYGIPKSTLQRNALKLKSNKEAHLIPNYSNARVFSDAFEETLAKYLIDCSNMFYGLTPTDAKRLAYELADRNKLPMPKSWKENKTAGKEWLFHFMTRHPELSLRQPEATSLARASSFNRENVSLFFDHLENLLLKINASGFSIYNLDESGCTTVQKVPKTIAPKGQKQVGQITSQERGELVTIVGIVSAAGLPIPPVFIFPRINFKDCMTTGVSEGVLGLASGNGWMKNDKFIRVLEHFIHHARPTSNKPVILILDNHRSHLSVEALEFAKEKHVHVLTLPPHTSNKTQPLDRTVFGPFKTHFNAAANALMMKRPGKNITIYDMGMLMDQAWLKAATPENIKAGFQASGIWPFNRETFSDIDFLPAQVTDRELPHPPTTEEDQRSIQGPSTSKAITPEDIRGYPKAPPRKLQSGHKRGKSMAATSTPELDRIRKASKKNRSADLVPARKELFESDSEEEIEIHLDDNSDVESIESTPCATDSADLILGEIQDVAVGDFVLVKFETKKSVSFYIGIVLNEQDEDGDIEVEFLRKSGKMEGRFIRPNVPDLSSVALTNVKLKLTRDSSGTTKRTQHIFAFKVNLSSLNVL